jgi:hypothetical protein
MFLYAKVVLDNLFFQGSQAELENELTTEIFPERIEAAYCNPFYSSFCHFEAFRS